MAQRRAAGLQQGIGPAAIAGTLFVNLAAAVFLVIGVTAHEALAATPILFVAAGLIFLLSVLSYIEGIGMLPGAGGSSGYARTAFNELVSFLAAWALLLDYLIIVAITAFFSVHYLSALPHLAWLADEPWDTVGAVVLVGCVGVLNARRVRLNAVFAVVISLAALVLQVALAVIGLALVWDPGALSASLDLGTAPTWGQIAFALPIAMIGFTGLEVAANLSGELREGRKTLARAMLWTAVVSALIYALISIVSLSALPVETINGTTQTLLGMDGDGFVDRPIIGVVENLGLSQGFEYLMVALVAILAAASLFIAANLAMIGMTRLIYSMSLHRQVPSALARIDRDKGVPAIAVLLFPLLAAGILVFVDTLRSNAIVLAQLYAFGAMFSLTIANASILWLRWTKPDLPRAFRAPLTLRVGGRELPLTVLLALVCTLGLWLLVIGTHDAARALGLIWMVVGFVGYGTYRLNHGLTLTEVADPRERAEVDVSARRYRRILLAVRPERGSLYGDGDAELAALAHKLLDDPDGEVAVMLVHELPLIEPLSAPLGDAEARTTQRLIKLRAVSEKLGFRLSSTVTRARAAGRAICQEAQRRDADVVLLATRAKPRTGDLVFGKCVSYVLRHAPCDVVIMRFPEGSFDAPSKKRIAAELMAASDKRSMK